MANDSFIYMVKAHYVGEILGKLSNACPSRRETEIQNAKLDRMAEAFRKRFTFAQATQAGGPDAKLRKTIGVEIHRLDQQAKKVLKLLNKALEEDYFASHPRTTTRSVFRRVITKANHQFEKEVFAATQQFRKKVLAAVTEHKRLTT